LFNHPQIWQPQYALVDIQQATRNVIWIKPDHIIIYDRAASAHPGLFKRFNLNFITTPSVTGNTVTEVTPGGQNLFVQTLLPTNATLTYVPLGNSLTTVADLEPSVGRVVIEDTNNPVNTRFLHVLQGANSNATPDTVTHVVGTGGNAFEGATVRGVIALFPVNALSNNFSSVIYTVPNTITNHYIAGLTPGASYAISQAATGGLQQVTVTPGPGLVADPAGLLSFNNGGQTLSGAPRFTAAHWTGSNLRLTGTGMANLTYSILTTTNLASTNWTIIGSTTADTSGSFQFIDAATSSSPQRFYRVSWP
jgi:hypothetical protein